VALSSAILIGVASLGGSAFSTTWGLENEPRLPPLSVAIVPFSYTGDDGNRDEMAERFTADLTDALVRDFRSAQVTAAAVAAAYQGTPMDAQKIGGALGVRYLVTGRIQRASNHVAVDAQMVNSRTGAQIWNDRVEGAVERLSSPSGGLAVQLMRRVRSALRNVEMLRIGLRAAPNETPLEQSLRASNILYVDNGSVNSAIEAKRVANQALARAPDLLNALSVRLQALEILRTQDPKADVVIDCCINNVLSFR